MEKYGSAKILYGNYCNMDWKEHLSTKNTISPQIRLQITTNALSRYLIKIKLYEDNNTEKINR